MRFAFLLFLFIATFLPELLSQKFLIIERAGTPKTERIAIFDEITFQFKDDDKGWYTRQITDLNADAQLVLLGDTWIALSEISRIHLKRKRVLATVIGGALQGGGASMVLGDLYYNLRGTPEYTQGGMEFGVVNMIVGTAVRALLEPIKYRLGKKTRLRVIDITFRSNNKT